ncbi:MAG: hypothetical protein PHS37_08475, partial [Candidatus Omnitrophica bacterium]|nr:hypothetical protein [Candidatus Omnitrophota bacterium]
MYRKTLGFIVVTVILSSISAFAGDVGNCILPLRTTTENIGAGASFEYNYVDNRLNNLDNKYGPRDMKITDFNQLIGKIEVGLFDNYNLYVRVGGQHYHLKFVDRAQDADMTIDLDNGILAGAGANCLFPFYDIDNLYIGGDIQSDFFYNDVRGLTRSGGAGSEVDGSFYGVDGQESIYLAYKWDIDDWDTKVVPYVGGYHSWMLIGTAYGLTYTTASTGYVDNEDFQAAFDFLGFGVLAGLDIYIQKYVNLNIEGRFIGENALTAGVT